MKYCSKCGFNMEEPEKFCSHCGNMNFDKNFNSSLVRVDDEVIFRVDVPEETVKGGGKGCLKSLEIKAVYLTLLIPVLIFIALFIVINIEKTNKIGNSFDNLMAGGRTAFQGDWVFFCSSDGLYKVRQDGDSPTRLTEGHFSAINLIGNWIYCEDEEGRIIKLSTDGEKEIILTNVSDYLRLITATDKYLFAHGSNNEIFRLDQDGGSKIRIAEMSSDIIDIIEDRLILLRYIPEDNEDNTQTFGNNQRIQILNTNMDGEDKRFLFEGRMGIYGYLKLIGNTLIYQDNPSGELMAFDLEKKLTKSILKERIDMCNIVDGNIYYTADNTGDLYKMRIDGTGKFKIGNRVGGELCAAGNILVYTERSFENIIMINSDGTGKQVLGKRGF